jgi:hypothetical protein
MRRLIRLFAPATIALSLTYSGVAIAANTTSCGGQRCAVNLTNQAGSKLNLGVDANNAVILFTPDSAPTQEWDIFQASDGHYIIYNHSVNNGNDILARDTGCTSNGGTYTYCLQLVPDPGAGNRPQSDQWIELRTGPFVFENADSGARCLDNPGGNASAGDRAVLFLPCNTSDAAEKWLG